jgi:uncharacterized protein
MNVASQHHVPSEFRGHLEGLRAGEIRFPRCRTCGRVHWYPMKRCPHCLSDEIGWMAVEGPGRLHSWTVVRRAFSPDFVDKIPYIVGLVEFDEVPGTRLITNVVDCNPEDLAIGMALEPVFETQLAGQAKVLFRPAREGARR